MEYTLKKRIQDLYDKTFFEDMKEISIKQFVERFNRGDFDSPSRNVQCEAGWYDWWCKDSSLASKTKRLGKCVASIMDSKKFDKKKTYVFFKNNCPAVGALYDQFSICDIESGDVLYCCQHLEKGSHGCEKAHWEVFGENEFHTPLASGTWKDVKNFFMK